MNAATRWAADPQRDADGAELEQLAVAAGQGDVKAWDQLYGRLNGVVRRAVRAVVGDSMWVDDIVGDVWLIVSRSIVRYQSQGAGIRAWIKRVATNRAVSWCRKQQLPTAYVDVYGLGVRSAETSPEQAAQQREWARQTVTAMLTLSAAQREVIVCRFLLGLDVADTAERLGLGESAVKQHTARGLRRLTAMFGDEERVTLTSQLMRLWFEQMLTGDSGRELIVLLPSVR